jgi:hypothetical protein
VGGNGVHERSVPSNLPRPSPQPGTREAMETRDVSHTTPVVLKPE